MRILHVIKLLSGGGGSGRAACDTARALARLTPVENRIASLLPAQEGGLRKAREAGLEVLDAPDPATLRQEIERADVLHVHWWNDPGIYRLLMSDLPPARLLLFVHVAGDAPPNVLIPELAEVVDVCAAGCAYVLGCPALRDSQGKAVVVPATTDFSRLDGIERVRPEGGPFNVGYIGTADFKKMHPEFVAMSARARIPEARFIVCGRGHLDLLRRQAGELGAADRFDFRGHVEDVASVLGELDVFGYPLSANPGAELAVQEAMYAGVPPVVFPLGGLRELVRDGETGLVVHSPEEYTRALERLHGDPAERRRLGANAREHVRQHLGAERAARKLLEVYEDLMQHPKRRRCWPGERETGAALFVRSLGDEAGEPFRTSLRGTDRESVEAAERRIAASSPLMRWGLAQYRDAFPGDPHLQRWQGLAAEALP